MATLLSTIRTNVRLRLNEPTANFWTDQELLDLIIHGCYDLWRAVVDLHQEHFLTVDTTNVSMAASTGTLTGVPADVFRILSIEPRDISSTAGQRFTLFQPLDYQAPMFVAARSWDAVDPSNWNVIFYAITAAGSPVTAPTIYVAPQITSALTLRMVYIPTLGTLTAASNNPIPGQSDLALEAWTVAYARAKEREDRSPDPNWIAIYSTEKQSILTASTPRQEQEPRVVSGIWDAYYPIEWQ